MEGSYKKIALVTDWITHWGGAERVFERLMQLYPEADIYTSVYFPDRPEVFLGRNIKTSFIQKIPFLNRRHKLCMLFRPLAFSRFDFSSYDLVISCTSAEAKGIYTNKKTKHICYCHTPTRYLWSHSENYKNFLEFGWLNGLARLVIPLAFRIMRSWDKKAAQRPNLFIANSINTQKRIKQYYGRDSIVVYPFFQKGREEIIQYKENTYLVCLGRIVPYKRFDLTVAACNSLQIPLKIFTSTLNDEVEKLQALSSPIIEWIFSASDAEVAEGLAGASGFLMPQEEDFGIVALEAMSHGIPVIAYAKGGALETVIDNETGVLFAHQTAEDLIFAIQKSLATEWNPEKISYHAHMWSTQRFDAGITEIVRGVL